MKVVVIIIKIFIPFFFSFRPCHCAQLAQAAMYIYEKVYIKVTVKLISKATLNVNSLF